jgi:hypothetical protein
MEFYDDSPATRFFTDQMVLLSGGRKQDEVTHEWEFTERIFYANYDFESKSIGFSIFDDVIREYVLKQVWVEDYESAETLLMEVAKTYPGKVRTKDFLPKWKVFYTAMKDSVYIESQVTEVDGSCDTCGDYDRDEFIFLYVPAVPGTGLDQPSLALHWEFGCFGGTKFAGVYEDVVDKVTAMAERMEGFAEEQYVNNVKVMKKALAKIS